MNLLVCYCVINTNFFFVEQNPGLKSWKWFVDLSHVEFKTKEEVLGEGKFSKCILGKLYGTYVAVKKFKREASTVNQFQSEGTS